MEQRELISSGVETIAAGLGLGEGADDRGNLEDDPPKDEPAQGDEAPPEGEEAPPAEGEEGEPASAAPVAKPPPKSWAKDYHEDWGKVPPKVQEYIELREKQMLDGIEQYKEFHGLGKSIKEVVSPYMPMLQASGVDPAKAVAVLLNANYRLTQGPAESRKQAFIELGTSLGIIPPGAVQGQAPEPPAVREMRERLMRLEGSLTESQQIRYEEARTRVSTEVEAFSKNAPYFEEVADDIVAFINAGCDLKTAYDKAVYANPTTRAKEIARLENEAAAKLKAKARGEVDAARRGTAANIRGRDSLRAPTEPKGKFLDEKSMLQDLHDIKSRTH